MLAGFHHRYIGGVIVQRFERRADDVLRVRIRAGMHDALDNALMLRREFNRHDTILSQGYRITQSPRCVAVNPILQCPLWGCIGEALCFRAETRRDS